jgi:hypothetical protein
VCYVLQKKTLSSNPFNIIAKPNKLTIYLGEDKSFAFINATEAEAITKEEIIDLCNKFWKSILEANEDLL